MHIFCDESGGAHEGLFLVCSVRADRTDARRFIKRFRQLSRILAVEIKGSALNDEQRKQFVSLMKDQSIHAGISVCSDRDPLGGWAFKAMQESEIWSHLVSESSRSLMSDDCGAVHINPDEGRYNSPLKMSSEALGEGCVSAECSR